MLTRILIPLISLLALMLTASSYPDEPVLVNAGLRRTTELMSAEPSKGPDSSSVPMVRVGRLMLIEATVDGQWMTDPDNPFTTGSGDYTNSLLALSPTHIFTYQNDSCISVAVSGSFNGWDKTGYRMVKTEGTWSLPLNLKRGKYLYKLVVDGRMVLDPCNPWWEENEYGTGNSIIWIE